MTNIMRVLLAAALTSASGCAATFDLGYLAVGPDARDNGPSTGYEMEPVTSERRVRFDRSAGLVCEDVEQPTLRRTSGGSVSEHPNGWLGAMWGGTMIDGLVLGIVLLVRELCEGQCEPRENVYPWFSPVAASFLWGIYRSLTIHPEIMTAGSTSRGVGLGESVAYPCPPGTLVEVVVGTTRALVPLDDVGQLEPSARPEILAVLGLDGEVTVRIGGLDVHLVEGGLQLLRQEARALLRASQPASQPALVPGRLERPEPPSPPRTPLVPGGVEIELDACFGQRDCRRR